MMAKGSIQFYKDLGKPIKMFEFTLKTLNRSGCAVVVDQSRFFWDHPSFNSFGV